MTLPDAFLTRGRLRLVVDIAAISSGVVYYFADFASGSKPRLVLNASLSCLRFAFSSRFRATISRFAAIDSVISRKRLRVFCSSVAIVYGPLVVARPDVMLPKTSVSTADFLLRFGVIIVTGRPVSCAGVLRLSATT